LNHFDPTSLREDVLETLVISENVHFSSQKKMSPSQKSMHNCRQLEIMSGVVLLIRLQLARGISNNFLLLHQYCAKTLERGITKDLVRLGFIRRSQNWSSDQFLFQRVESNITLRRPNVLDVFLEKIRERLRNLRKVLHEPSTIAC
jgi:hypothetical protein